MDDPNQKPGSIVRSGYLDSSTTSSVLNEDEKLSDYGKFPPPFLPTKLPNFHKNVVGFYTGTYRDHKHNSNFSRGLK